LCWLANVVVAGALVQALPAAAAVFAGSFSGIAFNSRIDAQAPWASDFDGETVTGSFRLDTAALYEPESGGTDTTVTGIAAGGLEVVIHAAGSTVQFGGAGDDSALVWTWRDGGIPTVQLVPNAGDPYHFAVVQFAGPLFDVLDPRTLHTGPIDLTVSEVFFFESRDFGANVQLTAVTFAVPEPQAWALLLSGCGVLAWRLRAAMV
jgi:hypothetical protein